MAKNGFMVATIDPEEVNKILRECARDIILPYHGKLEAHHKSFKQGNPQNEVTIADHESEKFLTDKLKALLPGSYVVGEEACEDDLAILDHLKDPQKTVWVIDPIDGTSNFARGSETFCVLIALVSGGETKMGWIYDVCNDSIAFAEKGRGAFLDGGKMSVADHEGPDKIPGFAGYRDMKNAPDFDVKTLRCSGLEYFSIAKGDALFSVYGRMKPWDHLAGCLIVQEAGGHVSKWDGSVYQPGDEKGGIVTAANVNLWQRIRSAIPDKALQKQGLNP